MARTHGISQGIHKGELPRYETCRDLRNMFGSSHGWPSGRWFVLHGPSAGSRSVFGTEPGYGSGADPETEDVDATSWN